MVRLRVLTPTAEPFVHSFEGDSLVIGRSSDADLPLADRFLSRQHARLFRDGERILVEDLDSHNGTFLNDQPVKAATEIRPGDVIKLSGTVVTLLEEGEEPGTDATDTLYRRADEILESSSGTAVTPAVGDAEKLRTYAERLRILNEVHRALARQIDLEELLEMILERVFDHLEPEEGAVFLLGPDGQPYRAASRSSSGEDLLYSRSLIEEVVKKGVAALVHDAQTDSRFAAAESILSSGVRSILAAPLLDPEGVEGMIALSSRVNVREFHEEDMDLLVSLASVAALYIRNAALAKEALEGRVLAEELALARRIQVSLLPSQLPEVEGYELHGGNVPSRTVSGDYYEIVKRKDGREGVVTVADVSGKGIAASLLTACLEALASGLIEVDQPPEEICRLASRQLHARTPPEKYATAFVAALDFASGSLRYCNAGHNAALLVRAPGEVEELASTGPPVGLLPGAEYAGADALLEPGDLLVVYTDGITEATNPQDEEYGIERLAEECAEHRADPLGELAHRLESDLEAFASGVPFADDRTLVLIRRT